MSLGHLIPQRLLITRVDMSPRYLRSWCLLAAEVDMSPRHLRPWHQLAAGVDMSPEASEALASICR